MSDRRLGVTFPRLVVRPEPRSHSPSRTRLPTTTNDGRDHPTHPHQCARGRAPDVRRSVGSRSEVAPRRCDRRVRCPLLRRRARRGVPGPQAPPRADGLLREDRVPLHAPAPRILRRERRVADREGGAGVRANPRAHGALARRSIRVDGGPGGRDGVPVEGRRVHDEPGQADRVRARDVRGAGHQRRDDQDVGDARLRGSRRHGRRGQARQGVQSFQRARRRRDAPRARAFQRGQAPVPRGDAPARLPRAPLRE